MENQIKTVLEQLTSYAFTRATRVGATECMHFGISYKFDRKGNKIQIGGFSIHLQCPWRITKNDIIIVGSDDVYEQPDENAEYDENFDWDVQGGNLRDVKLQEFLQSEKLTVQSVTTDNFGGFELIFNNDIKLTVFPASSNKDFYSEHWRLLNNKDKNANHFVVSPSGIDDSV